MRKLNSYNEASRQSAQDQIAGNVFKGGIVPFDLLNRAGGAIRGAWRGLRGSGTPTDWLQAKRILMDDLMDAFTSFQKSLVRIGYSNRQIRNIRIAYEKNIEVVIDKIKEEIDIARHRNEEALRRSGGTT